MSAEPGHCSEHRDVAAFLDAEFDGVPDVAAEFPTLVGPANPNGSLVIRDETGGIIAHAAWRQMELRCAGRRVHAAGIGLVTTAASERGKGHATKLVERCLHEAHASGAEVALLFAPVRGLYMRLGFVPAGRERILRIPLEAARPDKRVRMGTVEDAVALEPLLASHPVGVSRSVAQFQVLLGVPGTRAHVLEDSGGIVAYCVEGKGRDLQGVIHEWAGEPTALDALLRAVAGMTTEPLWVLTPAVLPAPIEAESALGPVGLFKLLRPEAFSNRDPRELFGEAEAPAELPMYVWGLDSV